MQLIGWFSRPVTFQLQRLPVLGAVHEPAVKQRWYSATVTSEIPRQYALSVTVRWGRSSLCVPGSDEGAPITKLPAGISTVPEGHIPMEVVQLPAAQLWPAVHARPHAPQFAGSDCRSRQVPLQFVPPGVSVHAVGPFTVADVTTQRWQAFAGLVCPFVKQALPMRQKPSSVSPSQSSSMPLQVSELGDPALTEHAGVVPVPQTVVPLRRHAPTPTLHEVPSVRQAPLQFVCPAPQLS
jgi:hypothetical protein